MFYRVAGPQGAATILLLHGLPSPRVFAPNLLLTFPRKRLSTASGHPVTKVIVSIRYEVYRLVGNKYERTH
jgi:hypothetical protein